MEKLSQLVQEAPVIEWDEDVLDIVEPYFLFFFKGLSIFGEARSTEVENGLGPKFYLT